MKQRVSLEGLLCKDKSRADKIIFINDQWIKVALQAVATLDISRFFRCCDDTLSTDQAGMLVYYEIFNMDTLSDDYIGIDDTYGRRCQGEMGHFTQKILYKNVLFYLNSRAKNA